jgi:hypothetical protein
MPGGYYFGLDPSDWSLFIPRFNQHIGSSHPTINDRRSENYAAIENGIELQKEIKALSIKWEPIVAAAEEAFPSASRP